MQHSSVVVTDLDAIAAAGISKEGENDMFLRSLKPLDNSELDILAHRVYEGVNAVVDCTQCGNCCRSLIINVTHEEIPALASYLHITAEEAKERYIEESQQGNCFINTIPCHFFADNKCTIYEARFTECRDFPHLHKPGFKARLSGTLMHYGRCPIIYNTIEIMKQELGFES